MRTTHPLSEILEATMRREEPLLDTEWPAGEVLLVPPEKEREPRLEDALLKPFGRQPR